MNHLIISAESNSQCRGWSKSPDYHEHRTGFPRRITTCKLQPHVERLGLPQGSVVLAETSFLHTACHFQLIDTQIQPRNSKTHLEVILYAGMKEQKDGECMSLLCPFILPVLTTLNLPI